LKICYIKIGSSKIWFIEIGSLETVFRAMPIYQKFNLRLASAGALYCARHHQLALLDRYKSLKICES
jgi:hypothetical protein